MSVTVFQRFSMSLSASRARVRFRSQSVIVAQNRIHPVLPIPRNKKSSENVLVLGVGIDMKIAMVPDTPSVTIIANGTIQYHIQIASQPRFATGLVWHSFCSYHNTVVCCVLIICLSARCNFFQKNKTMTLVVRFACPHATLLQKYMFVHPHNKMSIYYYVIPSTSVLHPTRKLYRAWLWFLHAC